MKPSAAQCSICGKAFLESDAFTLPHKCPDCKRNENLKYFYKDCIGCKHLKNYTCILQPGNNCKRQALDYYEKECK